MAVFYLCERGCYLEMATKRSAEQEKKRTRMRTYRRLLEKRQALGSTCTYCPVPVEVLHHKDEDQSNNREDNLMSLCKEHHLQQVHASDSESYRFEEEAISKSNLSWSSAKNRRMPQEGTKNAHGVPVDRSTPPHLPWGKRLGGRVHFLWRTRWIHPITKSEVTASGTDHLMELLESWGYREVARLSEWI